MHEVKAFIRPELVERVIQELRTIENLPGLTLSNVRGHGRQAGQPSGGREFGDVAMTKLETVVPDDLLSAVLDALQRTASTGRSGDGKVFVLPVESAVKLRSGEVGPKVL